ncbi:phosphatidylinositol-4-phosphate 5-kinase [Nitzschia inconspicua]|uniref:Phosphatidylinositol-4-phosphate 5-kinase n=1 Tax=Nitzschia inconspicua TaxID=303405 RepID=A0A9K3PRK6_9STRA|nr:phosphatidylinositol-4-phosphate 5-kinase [Nitzschia inconspicua]
MIQHQQLQQQGLPQINDSKRRSTTLSAAGSAVHPPKRRKISDEATSTENNSNSQTEFFDHPFSHPFDYRLFHNDKRKINMTNPDPPSASSHVRQEQIEQLRNRVDSVLKNLVQSTEVGNQTLKTQIQALRNDSPNDNAVFYSTSMVEDGGGKQNTATKVVEQEWIVDPYGDQGEFQGELNADNLPHGTGIMKYSDGRVYSGEWKDGRWHGRGRATFSNGDVFEGMYFEDQRHGLGIYQWSDGREFKGGFVNDQRSGHGEYTWPDGAKYVGEFQKGLRHGEGTYTFSDGSFYKGSWRQGKYHGKGECFWSDGRVYRGDWENGKAHGYGKEVRPDGSIRHDGKWENDKPVRDP